MKRILAVTFATFCSLWVLATAQVPDLLVWKGERLSLFSNPLKQHVEHKLLDSIIALSIEKQVLEQSPDDAEFSLFHSGCRSGHYAEWVIVNDSLFLNCIHACLHDITVKPSELFCELQTDEMLFASWVSGGLFVPKGACIKYVNMENASVYEEELELLLEGGVLKDVVCYQNKIIRTDDFLHAVDYQRFIYSNVNWQQLPDLSTRTVQVAVTMQPTEQGAIAYIDKEFTYAIDSERDSVIVAMDDMFIKEAIRIAYLVPSWEVVSQRNKLIKKSLVIFFCERFKQKYGLL